MPITKVPIVHKFGIISHSQREELQERLMRLKFMGAQKSNKEIPTTRNPFELSEEFIRNFNAATDFEAKEEMEELAFKMLARAKRRVGLTDASRGNHVDLPKAWSELSMLAQCRGKVQEECLDVMIISLNQAPLLPNNINSLFYLAETTLYWLRTDAMDQPFLRIGEIKLLKMGQLVFTRLFFHHMAGHLHGYKEYKDRLITYLEALISGFTECEEAYNPYPSAHLALRYIAEVGAMIVGDDDGDAGEIKESDNILKNQSTIERKSKTYGRHSATADNLETGSQAGPSQAHSVTTIHDLSPSLWHSLDVWRCTVHLSDGFQEAVKALTLCGTGLATENWIDALCSFKVLSEAAKTNIIVLRALQDLAKGVVPPKTPVAGLKDDVKNDSLSDIFEDDNDSATSLTSTKSSFSDLETSELKFDLSPKHGSKVEKKKSSLNHNSSQSLRKLVNASTAAMIDSPQDKHAESLTDRSSFFNKDSRMLSTPATLPNISSRESLDSAGEMSGYGINQDRSPSVDSDMLPGDDSQVYRNQLDVTNGHKTALKLLQGPKMKREVSFDASADKGKDNDMSVQELRKSDDERSKKISSKTTEVSSKTGKMAQAGSQPVFASLPSTPKFSSRQLPNMLGLIGWRWEVAYAYTELMGHLCLHGNTSNIRKIALVGDKKQGSQSYGKKSRSDGIASAGLLDLVNFTNIPDTDNDTGLEDWSWRVRYGAVQGLIKICRCTEGDKSNEGMRTVAWNTLMKCHSKEKDDRVLEAIRVGQVDAQIEKEALKIDVAHSLDGRLAAGLSTFYLPPLAPPVSVTKRSPRHKVELPKPTQPLRKGPNRPSLKEELMLSTALVEKQPSFTTRTSLDLKRIVEDQWRKELHEMLQKEEEERCNEEELQQKETEKKTKIKSMKS